jgi:hypothetical protein
MKTSETIILPVVLYESETWSLSLIEKNMMAVCKVRGLTLLRVGTLWRCGDGLFFEVSPLARMHFL